MISIESRPYGYVARVTLGDRTVTFADPCPLAAAAKAGACMSEQSAHPILFSTPLVRAIREGRKTQTRRVVKPQPPEEWHEASCEWYHPIKVDRHGEMYPGEPVYGFADEESGWVCPYGAPSDLLWVRETFRVFDDPDDARIEYKAGGVAHQGDDRCRTEFKYSIRESEDAYHGVKPFVPRWRPSIHMPRWASRLTLRVTDVRAQRLRDITEEDAVAEGIDMSVPSRPHTPGIGATHPSAVFSDLWDSINAKRGYGWDVNPWVWALTFEVVEGGAA